MMNLSQSELDRQREIVLRLDDIADPQDKVMQLLGVMLSLIPFGSTFMGMTKLFYDPKAQRNKAFNDLVYLTGQKVEEIAQEFGTTKETILAYGSRIQEIEERDPRHEKRQFLQQAFANAIIKADDTGQIESDQTMMFLNFIDIFTPTHIRILQQISEPPDPPSFTTDDLLKQPDFDKKEAFYFNVVGDLSHRMLVNTDFIAWRNGAPKLVKYNITSFGQEFIAFIQ